MLSILFRNRKDRIRQEILKGVFEENLRIIGKAKDRRLSRKPISRNTFFITGLAFVIIVTLYGTVFGPPFFETRTTTADVTHVSQRPETVGTVENPADYKALVSDPKMSISRTLGLGVRTIMIDAGHGGEDPGTKGRMGTKEKDIALDISRRLRDRLEKYGRFNVIMTRSDDSTLTLNRRVEMALANKADIFISVHLNYLPSKPINTIETYYFGPSSDNKVLKLAAQENAGSQFGMSDFREIVEKMGEKLKLQESKELAASIQKDLYVNIKREHGNAHDFGVKRAPFVVLLGENVPAVLTEVSCLSNKEEEQKLNTEQHRENIARYLETGILDYIKKGEKVYESASAER